MGYEMRAPDERRTEIVSSPLETAARGELHRVGAADIRLPPMKARLAPRVAAPLVHGRESATGGIPLAGRDRPAVRAADGALERRDKGSL
jgi:hypothetical protein